MAIATLKIIPSEPSFTTRINTRHPRATMALSTSVEKPDISEREHHDSLGEHRGSSQKITGNASQIGAIVAAQGNTPASFAHLDEKKILKKVRVDPPLN